MDTTDIIFSGKEGRRWLASAGKPRLNLLMKDTETPYVVDIQVMFLDRAMALQFIEDFKE